MPDVFTVFLNKDDDDDDDDDDDRTRFKQIFCSSRKDSTYRKCSIALFLVASMSALFDNRCLSPSVSHSSSMSPVLEC